MYDVIVVGARCAGASTAMLYARSGHSVLLLDRGSFPSDTMSTNYIHQPGVERLGRWGLLEEIRATDCPPLDTVVYEVSDVRLEGGSSGVDGYREAYAPRRRVLDKILVDGAVAADVELREQCSVTGLLRDDQGRVIGVAAKHGNRSFTEQAALVVGADGMRSTVARLAEAEYTVRDPRMTCAYYDYWEDVPAHFELYEGPGKWVGAVPTNDNTTLIATYFPQERFDEIRKDAEREYLETIQSTAPALRDRLAGKRRTEGIRGTGDQRNFFRRAHGSGWALVGDAGHHKDSISARGISDAFLQAEHLVENTAGVLDAPEELDEGLQRYEHRRDAELVDGYKATLIVAQLQAKQQRIEMLRAIGADPALTELYFDTVAGVRPVEALYTPELMAML
ncbi:flavin-dependent dehydrogenase [Actinopolyspora lacussalsi]|nr:flavin-dependent dehydrogenase [Actinopolyspora lacussalsi]